MQLKSERLKKLESELGDLKQWKKLGLVPKNEIEKHNEEIVSIEGRIEEEKERLKFLKENGDIEEYVAPKKVSGKQAYAEPQTLPGIETSSETEGGYTMETDSFDVETSSGEEEHAETATLIEEMEEDPFSDKNRWKRGILEGSEGDEW